MTPQEEEKYQKWLSTFSDYITPEEGRLFVMRKSSDINTVFDELEQMGV